MKHIDLTIKAPKPEPIKLPSWWGRATSVISALADDPHALDDMPMLDIDAIYRKDVE